MCRSPPKGQNQPYLCLSEELLEANHTYLYLYMPDTDDVTLRNSFTLKQLLHTCLTHLSLGTYVHTFFFFSTTVISSIPFNCYPYHSLTHSDSDSDTETASQIPYYTLPTQNFKLSIHPVRELVAGCSDSRSKTYKRHPGGEIAKDEELPCYPSWVICQRRRRRWCCSMGRWASSYGGGLCLSFISRMYKSGKIR